MELRQYFVTRKTPIDSKDYKTNVLTPWLHNSLTPESWANAKLELLKEENIKEFDDIVFIKESKIKWYY